MYNLSPAGAAVSDSELAMPPRLSRQGAVRFLSDALLRAGIGAAREEARVLVRAAARLSPEEMIAESGEPLGAGAQARLQCMARRRLAGEPVTRILGRREFWGLMFAVTSAVLDPRPATETLVEAALRGLRARRNAALRLLDLGTGSGALLCALLTELPNAIGLGVDLSPAAACVATANLRALGLTARGAIVVGDWTSAVAPGFDLIVSNPPYIASADIAGLDAEVRLHDPRLALDGGESGLDAYRTLAKTIGAALAPRGLICVEAGAGQAGAISEIFAAHGFVMAALDQDLGGHARCLTLRAQ